jgi:hypothetical protein
VFAHERFVQHGKVDRIYDRNNPKTRETRFSVYRTVIHNNLSTKDM